MTEIAMKSSITPAIFAKKPPAPKQPTFFDPINPSCNHIVEGMVWCVNCAMQGYKACKKRVKGLIHIKAGELAIIEAMQELERMEYEYTFTKQGSAILDAQFYSAIYEGNWEKAYYLNDLKEIRLEQAVKRQCSPESWVSDFVPEINIPKAAAGEAMPTFLDMRSALFNPDEYTLQLTKHAKIRMKERKITFQQIFDIYKNPKGLRVHRNDHFYLTDYYITIVGSINTIRGEGEFSILTTYYNNSVEKD